MNLQSSDILLTDNIDEVVSLVSGPDNYVILLYCTSGRITVDLNGREVMVCRLRSLWARVGDSCGRGEGVETPKSLGESEGSCGRGDDWETFGAFF